MCRIIYIPINKGAISPKERKNHHFKFMNLYDYKLHKGTILLIPRITGKRFNGRNYGIIY